MILPICISKRILKSFHFFLICDSLFYVQVNDLSVTTELECTHPFGNHCLMANSVQTPDVFTYSSRIRPDVSWIFDMNNHTVFEMINSHISCILMVVFILVITRKPCFFLYKRRNYGQWNHCYFLFLKIVFIYFSIFVFKICSSIYHCVFFKKKKIVLSYIFSFCF